MENVSFDAIKNNKEQTHVFAPYLLIIIYFLLIIVLVFHLRVSYLVNFLSGKTRLCYRH